MNYLNKKECETLFAGKEIFVFGAGVDGENLYHKLADSVTIAAFVDNRRYGAGNFLCGKEILSLEQMKRRRNKNQPIIIAAYRYGLDISNQLMGAGFNPESDFYIWDDMGIYHADDATKKYIDFMSDIWKGKKVEKVRKKILVPFDNRHDQNSVQYAYCGNYLAQKHQASLYGYCRYGTTIKNASPVVYEIYKAFNVVGLVDSEVREDLQEEADKIFKDVWKNLYTWEDWKNITVYGIRFGTTVIRDYLRENVPEYDLRASSVEGFIKRTIGTIVSWYHYFEENDVAVVLMADAVCWEGYIRDIAISRGIPVYAVEYIMQKAYVDFHGITDSFLHYKEMWNQLTEEEKQYGIEWAREHVKRRIQGSCEEVEGAGATRSSYAAVMEDKRVLDDDDKMKILICPHIFEEDCYWCGEQIFDDSYMEWLCHLGELSEQTPNYHWYLKVHPFARRRDLMIMENFVKRYPKIKLLPINVSPHQLKKEGAKFALTVCGTIGHEYPALGIEIINAGINPHSAFNFTWNPRTKEEYDELIFNLEKLSPKNNMDELYQFYCMHYLFYDREYIPYRTLFYENPLLPMCKEELEAVNKELGTWKYEAYMEEWTGKHHQYVWNEMENLFRKMDDWRPDIFYKRVNKMK